MCRSRSRRSPCVCRNKPGTAAVYKATPDQHSSTLRGPSTKERTATVRTCCTAVSVVALAFGLGFWGCGPSASSNTANPGGPSSPSGSIVAIDVVGVAGPASFRPNPAKIVAGQMVVWRNLDSVTHRIGFDDRSLDTGNIASGTSSSPMPIQRGGPYHCRLYPVLTSGTVVVVDSHP
jgi:plastocyanin